jgi:DNA helicase II / ATP-dependent DNA helicase PcrA
MILSRPDAPLGSVSKLHFHTAQDFTVPDAAILCRNTAPLIEFALALLRRGVACHVVGKDIQVGLDRLIDKIGGTSRSDFNTRLGVHEEKEVQRLIRKGRRQQAEGYSDKCAALRVLCFADPDSASVTTTMKSRLAKIFANGDGITLSTVHKAKGLEWTTVFLLDWHLLPSRYAETQDELTQERNLQYVAVTRAKLDLRFVTSEGWK